MRVETPTGCGGTQLSFPGQGVTRQMYQESDQLVLQSESIKHFQHFNDAWIPDGSLCAAVGGSLPDLLDASVSLDVFHVNCSKCISTLQSETYNSPHNTARIDQLLRILSQNKPSIFHLFTSNPASTFRNLSAFIRKMRSLEQKKYQHGLKPEKPDNYLEWQTIFDALDVTDWIVAGRPEYYHGPTITFYSFTRRAVAEFQIWAKAQKQLDLDSRVIYYDILSMPPTIIREIDPPAYQSMQERKFLLDQQR